MVASKTKLSKILNNAKGLSKLVSSSNGYTVKMLIADINYKYGTNITLGQVRAYVKSNGLDIRKGNLKIKTLNDYLNFLKRYACVGEKSRENPNTRSRESRRLSKIGNPHSCIGGKGRIVKYGKTLRSI